MIPEKRKCKICGLFFPRDGKRTVCSVTCYEYRRKFVFASWKKKEKVCKICNAIIKDPERKTLCSPECVFISEAQHRKAAYAKLKAKLLRRAKNTAKDSKRGKHLRTLDKESQTPQEAESNHPRISEQNTERYDSFACACYTCQNRAKKVRQRRKPSDVF